MAYPVSPFSISTADPAPELPPLIAEVTAQYDDYGTLASSVARRLAARLADSGKTCPTCELDKPLSAFGRDSHTVDGLRAYCRECIRLKNRARALAKAKAASASEA